MPLSRALPAALVVLALGVAPSSAQQVEGDTGQPPTSAAECQAFLKSVDADLKWENDRYAKARGKKLDRRAALGKKLRALKAEQVAIEAQDAAIIASLETEPPPAQDVVDAAMAQVEELRMTFGDNRVKIQDLADRIEGIDSELAEMKKLHRSNVRNTVGYRKQVADYCKRF